MRGLITEIIALFNSNLFLQIPTNIKPLILLNSYKKTLNSTQGFYNKSINYRSLLKDRNFECFKHYQVFKWEYSLWERYLQKKSFSKILKNLTSDNLLHSNDGITLFNMESQKLTIKESPYWIKKRLLLMGFKPVNNIIDTINYLLLETGQVFFAYDLEILQQLTETSEIVFVPSYAPEKSVFPIEESKTIELTKDVLVLNINNKIISIAGLIQNYHTLVNTETSYVILQYGLYDSKKVKKSSKILGLRTNYSIKLEKQTDLNLFEQAHLRLMHIFWTQNIKFEDMRTNKKLFLSLKDNSSLLFRYVEQSQKKERIVYKNLKLSLIHI